MAKKNVSSGVLAVQVEQKDLSKAIAAVLGVVDKKTTMPILANVYLKTNGNGLEVGATDLELSIKTYCPATIKSAGAVTVPAHKLAELLKGKIGEIQLTETPGFNLELVRNGSRFTLAGIDPAQFPPIPAKPGFWVEVEAGPLSNMLGKVLHAVSGDPLDRYLNAVLIEAIKPDTLRLAATDGHRLALAEGKTPAASLIKSKGITIPRAGAYQLIQFLKGCDKIRLSIENERLVIVDGDRLLAMRLVTEGKKFPDYQRILPSVPVYRFTFNREELAEAVKSVGKLSTDRFKGVVFRFSKKGAALFFDNPETGAGEETLASFQVEHGKPIFEMGFNARYLLEPLAVMQGEKVVFEITGNDKPLKLTAPDNPDYIEVIMPMSL